MPLPHHNANKACVYKLSQPHRSSDLQRENTTETSAVERIAQTKTMIMPYNDGTTAGI